MAERRVVNLLRAALPSVLSTATALALGFLAIAFTRAGFSGAAAAYGQMLKGGVGDWSQLFEGGAATVVTRPLGETSVKAALLILTGLSVSVAFWVGLFNIGAQGQLLVGALTAAVLGAALPLPAALHIPVCLLGAALGGGLYALIPAVLRERRGVHEVLSTIMLNWIAVSVIESWLVTGPLRARSEGTSSRSGTEPILASAQLPRLLEDGSRLHLGFLLALVLAAVVWVWLYRTWHGFEIRAAGLGPRAAQTAGIPVRRRIYQAMALSGALAGLAGAVLVQGTELQYPGILAAPYGFDGIAMAMLGQSHPLGVVLVSVFFGALRAGGTRMQLLGVHKSFPELIQGLALLLVAGRLLWRRLQAREPTPTDPDPDPVGEVETNARPGGGAVNVLAFVEALLSSTLNALPALVFAALGAVLTERSGVIDIGVEGMMRVGAYFAAVAALVMPTPLAVMVGMAAGAGWPRCTRS